MIKEYDSIGSIGNAQLDGVFKSETTTRSTTHGQGKDGQRREEYQTRYNSLKELLNLSNYSDAQHELRQLEAKFQELKIRGKLYDQRLFIDESLLADKKTKAFSQDMDQFLKTHTRTVSVDTSKRVLRHFVRNVTFAEAESQTTFDDQKIIKKLEDELE